jgi:hypothetical protein
MGSMDTVCKLSASASRKSGVLSTLESLLSAWRRNAIYNCKFRSEMPASNPKTSPQPRYFQAIKIGSDNSVGGEERKVFQFSRLP